MKKKSSKEIFVFKPIFVSKNLLIFDDFMQTFPQKDYAFVKLPKTGGKFTKLTTMIMVKRSLNVVC